MSASPRTAESLRSRLETLIALARLLERVESKPSTVSPDQYQALIRQVRMALDNDLPQDALQAVLGAHPATAEVYENMHYEFSGLSRARLERSVQSEMATSQLLGRLRKGAPQV